MAMRMPTIDPDRPHQRATCEIVFEAVLEACGPIIDGPGIHRVCSGERTLIRYVRDALGLFAQLGQVEHVRRDLWLADPPFVELELQQARDEYLRAAVAARALGPWTVIAGAWALALHGLIDVAQGRLPGTRFALTPRPARPATYSHGGRERWLGLAPEARPSRANAARHVTTIRGEVVAAVTRPLQRYGCVAWREQFGFGAHVLDVPHAFVSLLEHPRLGGGHATASGTLPAVLARTGIEPLVAVGRAHPSVAVRRRLALVLLEAFERTEGAGSWFGPDADGIVDDDEHLWRITRQLRVSGRGAPTLLEPHRLPSGPRRRLVHVIDNRFAPVRGSRRFAFDAAVAMQGRGDVGAQENRVGEAGDGGRSAGAQENRAG